MDGLNLSYGEVWDGIPYRNLLLMQKDKLRPVYDGDVMHEMDEAEYMQRYKKSFNNKK